MNTSYTKSTSAGNSRRFDIREYVEFDHNGRAECPYCAPLYSNKNKTLSVTIGGERDGAYHCYRCENTEEIRASLGVPKIHQVPTRLAQHTESLQKSNKKDYRVGFNQIKQDHLDLINLRKQCSLPAIDWLHNRGFSDEMISAYNLGLARAKYNEKKYESISIPVPQDGLYHRKKRLIPWEKNKEIEANRPWSQAGIPAMPFFSWNPPEAKETWLCEGEWDAMMLGWLVRQIEPNDIAVACFTCGCKNLPGKKKEEIEANLAKLPGRITIFYDRNDKPHPKTGKKDAEEGAKKVAQALQGRGFIGQVPMPEGCTIRGWDVSDAINKGYIFEDFKEAAEAAQPYIEEEKPKKDNPLRQFMTSFEEIYDTAPDFVDWLVCDILTPNELFLLAAPPRQGKSLFALGLAKAIASGSSFLDRPVKQGKVLYICMEDSQRKVKTRLIAQDWTREEMKNVTEIRKFRLDQLPYLEEIIKEEKPSLVVLDTLSRIRSDNNKENSAEMAKAIEPLQDVAEANDCCILLVHHTRKNSIEKASDRQAIFDSVRGSGAIRQSCRGMLVLTEEKGQYFLAVENGDADYQYLKVHLNKGDLTWRLSGKWTPPFNPSQKELVLDFLGNVSQANIEQIAKATQIPKRSLYTVLMRLVRDNVINRKNSYATTVYYLTQQESTTSELLDDSIPVQDLDSRDLTKTRNYSETGKDRDKFATESLQTCPQSPSNSEKENFVESEKEKSEAPSLQTIGEVNNEIKELSVLDNVENYTGNIACPIASPVGHLGDVTKNFSPEVANPANSKGLRVGDKVSGDNAKTKIDHWIGTIVEIIDDTVYVNWGAQGTSPVNINLLRKI